MNTQSIGIREAKTHLSKYLKMVQKGNEIVLTDRGRPVGRIVPIKEEEVSLDQRINQLEEDGVLSKNPVRTGKKTLTWQPISVPDNIAQKILMEERNDA